jgi:hypothetical protein
MWQYALGGGPFILVRAEREADLATVAEMLTARAYWAHKNVRIDAAVLCGDDIDPAAVGNERRILLSELSGQSSVLAKTAKYAVTHDKALMSKILTQVQDLEHAGYEFEAAEASFDILVKKAMGVYQPKFERLSYRVNVEVSAGGEPVTEATVKIRAGLEAGDYKDPGWYKHPDGTVAHEWVGPTPASQRAPADQAQGSGSGEALRVRRNAPHEH